MSEQAADGRETDPANRWERIASGLEKNFEKSNEIVDLLSERIRIGRWSNQEFPNTARFMRASSQMASVLVRAESIKNRGSNTK